MSNIEKKHYDAGGDISEIIAAKLGNNRAVHSETAIASAARMAGLMLFRSFGIDTSKILPGTVVLSEEANEQGPELINIVAYMLEQFGLKPNNEKISENSHNGEKSKMTVLETQKLLEKDILDIKQKYQLSFKESAYACALTTAWLIKECAPQIGLEVGFGIAIYSFIEGTKTVPYSAENQDLNGDKKPWYRFWK